MVGLHAPVVLHSGGREILTTDLAALQEEHRHAAAIEVFFFDNWLLPRSVALRPFLRIDDREESRHGRGGRER
jgi:hypothetical protein